MPQVVYAVSAFFAQAALAITGSGAFAAAVGNLILWSPKIFLALSTAASFFRGRASAPTRADFGTPVQISAQANEPTQVAVGEIGVAGTVAFATTFDRNRNLQYFLALSDAGPIEGFVKFLLDGVETDIPSSKYATVMDWQGFLGLQPESHFSFGDAVPEWTPAHKLSGVAHVRWALYSEGEKYTAGVPQPIWVIRGVKCYDPRKDSTYPGGSGAHRVDDPDTWEWTRNGAIIALQYCLGWFQNGVRVAGLGAPLAFLDVPSFVAAANVADFFAWRCDGVLADDERAANLRNICATFGGEFTPVGGKLGVTYAAPRVSVMTLTDDDLAGPIKFLNTRPRRERYNQALPYFTHADDRYQMLAGELVTSETYLEEDAGEQRTMEVKLPLVLGARQARQLAALKLADTREHGAIQGVWKPKARQVKEGQCVTIESAILGVSGKFLVRRRALAPEGAVELELRAETDAKHAWAGALDAAAPTPTYLGRYDPSATTPPGAPALSESLYVTRDGLGVKARLEGEFAPSEDIFVTAYEARALPPGALVWRPLTVSDERTFGLDDVAPGLWRVRVRAKTQRGAVSAWVQSLKEVAGLAAAPAPVTGLNLQALSGVALLSWTRHPDLDVRVGGRIAFRHVAPGVAVDWKNGVTLGADAPGDAISALLPFKPGVYMARAFDSSGVQAPTIAAVTAAGGQIAELTETETIIEDAAFAGAHAGTAGDGESLRIIGVGLIDDAPDVDGLDDWDSYGGVAAEGVYSFAHAIDLGADKRVRLFTDTESVVVNTLDRIDDRAGMVDSWTDWDGADSGDADLAIEVRAKASADSDFGAWNRVSVGDYQARWFEFRARLSSVDPAYNIHVSKLRVSALEAA